MKFIELKIFTTLVTSLFVSAALAFNYIYFLHNPPIYDEFFISLFGYSLYVFVLFIMGASISFILDFKIKKKIYNFISYIISGCLFGLLFCLIVFRGVTIKLIAEMIILAIICAILFWIIQEILKRTFYKNTTSLL